MTVFRTKNNKIESGFYKAGANSDGADFYKFSLLKAAYSLFETDQVIRGKTNPEVVYKETINTTNIKSSISSQVKGHSITVYVTTLGADGIYTMLEVAPQSVESLELLTTESTLKQLLQVAYVFENTDNKRKRRQKNSFS